MSAARSLGRPIRVLAVDHTAGIAPFRRKFAAIARHPEIDLTVLAPDRWVENYRTVRFRADRALALDGYRIRAGSVVWPGYENRGFFVSGLAGALREARPDILHLWEEPYSLFALQALRLRALWAKGSRALFFSSDNLTRAGRYPYRPSWLYRRIEQYAFRQCDVGTAVSEEVVEVLRAKGYRGRIEVVPHGIDLEDFQGHTAAPADRNGRLGPRGPVIGYVGRMLRQKGVDTLIRAFAALPSSRAAAGPSLAIIGDGPDQAEFVALARSLGIGDRVRFLAGVPHGEVASLYRGIDVLVVPSRTTPKWKEQFGRVIIEGMAAGCVLIGSSSGAIPSVIGDAGLVVPEGDSPALAQAIARVLGDPTLTASLREQAQERVRRRYTWTAIVGSLVELYQRIAASPGAA